MDVKYPEKSHNNSARRREERAGIPPMRMPPKKLVNVGCIGELSESGQQPIVRIWIGDVSATLGIDDAQLMGKTLFQVAALTYQDAVFVRFCGKVLGMDEATANGTLESFQTFRSVEASLQNAINQAVQPGAAIPDPAPETTGEGAGQDDNPA